MEMVERPGAMPHIEGIRGRKRFIDIGLCGLDRARKLAALRKLGGNGRRKRAARPMRILCRKPRRRKASMRSSVEQDVLGFLAFKMAALDQDGRKSAPLQVFGELVHGSERGWSRRAGQCRGLVEIGRNERDERCK